MPDGSTNAYLTEERAIEEFLKDIEPRYNAAIRNITEAKIETSSVYALAGFAAYVTCCSPAAMRINMAPLENILQGTAKLLDEKGVFGQTPEIFEGKSLTQLLQDGIVKFDVDPKYSQAIGISNIHDRASTFGNARWEIFRNTSDSPFFSSDFPVAIEAIGRTGFIRRVVPLTPELAVRITPDSSMRGKIDLSFQKFTAAVRTANRDEVVALNRLIVQCAEDMIFFRDDQSWIARFIERNRQFRIDAVVQRIPHGGSYLVVAQQRIVRFS